MKNWALIEHLNIEEKQQKNIVQCVQRMETASHLIGAATKCVIHGHDLKEWMNANKSTKYCARNNNLSLGRTARIENEYKNKTKRLEKKKTIETHEKNQFKLND